MTKSRFLQSAVATVALLSMAEPILACGFFSPPPTPTDPPPTPSTWIKDLGNGKYSVSVQLAGLFAPTQTTICGCGISFLGNLPSSLNVTNVNLAVTNPTDHESTILPQFNDLTRNEKLDEGFATGSFTPNPSVGYQPISSDPKSWFAFSGSVDPFTPPTLEPDEIFTLNFQVEGAVPGLGLQFASGGINEPDHPITYSGGGVVLLPNEPVPEPSAVLSLVAVGLLGLGSITKQKHKVSSKI